MQDTAQFKPSSSECIHIEREAREREREKGDMKKESIRKCSHCGHNGHNSRTCNNRNGGDGKGCRFKLFGVKIDPNNKEDDQLNGVGVGVESSVRKSKSLGNLLATYNDINESNNVVLENGSLSDGHLHSKSARERRKENVVSRSSGKPWTEIEHMKFLVGLKKLGKGDWKGISMSYVPTRTPTQVASHAQKYFIRMTASEKKKRRSSVFDMPLKKGTSSPRASPSDKETEVSLQLSASPPTPMVTTTSNIPGQASTSKSPPSALSERPPLSPVARSFSIPDFQRIPQMVGYPNMAQRNMYTQTVYVPLLNYGNNNHIYPFATFMIRPLLIQQPLPNGSTQAAKRDGVEASSL